MNYNLMTSAYNAATLGRISKEENYATIDGKPDEGKNTCYRYVIIPKLLRQKTMPK